MTSPTPVKLEHLIARNMAEMRRERGWRQPDLAWRMEVMGLRWTSNSVAQVETLRRSVSLLEVTALSWVFEVPITRLLAGDEDIEMPDGETIVPLANIRAALVGDVTAQQRMRAESETERTNFEEIRKIAKTLDVEPQMLNWLARRLFGRDFIEERNARAGDLSDLPKRSAQTKRGHASRALTAEIRALIEKEGRGPLTSAYLQYQHERHVEALSHLKALQRGSNVD